ncbi:MAG TPA: class 1 isoprenoid biosynthesis enzyme, partial [Chitinophagaceae bacterium]
MIKTGIDNSVVTGFLESIRAGNQQHMDEKGPAVSHFIIETGNRYESELDLYLSTYKSTPELEHIIDPMLEKLREYLQWLKWVNWNIAQIGPVLFEHTAPASERLSLASLAYASGRLIDDGFDNHEDFKGKLSTLVGFLRERFSGRPYHAACAQSVFAGLHLFHHVLLRLRELGHQEAAMELSKLFNIASVGLLAECQAGDTLSREVYFQIVRRKSVAYNMMLYKPFLQGTDPVVRNQLLSFFAEMDELAQMINDLIDIDEDQQKDSMNMLTHLPDPIVTINNEIGTRLEKLQELVQLLPPTVRNACSGMLMNLKLEKIVNNGNAPTKLVKGSPEIAIESALSYLEGAQKENGEFETLWSENLDMQPAKSVSSPFVTGMVLLALTGVNGLRTIALKERSLAYLGNKRKSNGHFSFLEQGMDDDLDDTCLLNFLLQQHRNDHFNYSGLSESIHNMPSHEGLYYTWIRMNPSDDNDIDACVNVNVVRFLTANGIDCSDTVHSLQKVVQNGAAFAGTKYYETSWSLHYFVCTLPEDMRNKLVGNLSVREIFVNKAAHTPVDKAMKLYCLASLGERTTEGDQLLQELLALQEPSGAWPAYAVFRAFNYWGSAELTTA